MMETLLTCFSAGTKSFLGLSLWQLYVSKKVEFTETSGLKLLTPPFSISFGGLPNLRKNKLDVNHLVNIFFE